MRREVIRMEIFNDGCCSSWWFTAVVEQLFEMEVEFRIGTIFFKIIKHVHIEIGERAVMICRPLDEEKEFIEEICCAEL